MGRRDGGGDVDVEGRELEVTVRPQTGALGTRAPGQRTFIFPYEIRSPDAESVRAPGP